MIEDSSTNPAADAHRRGDQPGSGRVPLVVDLDGTLIHTDMLHESALRVLREHPLDMMSIPFWLVRGKAVLKRKLAERSSFDPASLPYHRELLDWLKEQRDLGRPLLLCTASDRSVADVIAEHLGIFQEVMASDGTTNLSGERKAEMLEQRFGASGFDYAGNATADLVVWERARQAIVVNADTRLIEQAADCCEIERVFAPTSLDFTAWRRVLRVHQWLKNALLFVPLLAAHQISNVQIWLSLLVAFCSFSLCASSVYIANDLLDLESDRQHPRKSSRPFASGLVPAWMGVLLAPLLLMASLTLAATVGGNFLLWLLVYFGLTCAYSWRLKRLLLIDCLTLAVLYTLRIVAGAAAANMPLSFWLLAFSVFLFLSLAFVKRYAELQVQLLHGKHMVHGRGYYTSDASLIQMQGMASGYVAVLVLALYLNSTAVLQLYRAPEFVWGAVLAVLFWVNWIWMQAHRGHMHDDPLVFAVKDKASLLAGTVVVAFMAVGTVGWPW